MSEHHTHLSWLRGAEEFAPKKIDLTHQLQFAGGTSITASYACVFGGNEKLPNPEELLVGAVSSCYMMTFLSVAAKEGFVIDSYQDDAVGILRDEGYQKIISEVLLRPTIQFQSHKKPEESALKNMIEKAHEHCIISQSIKGKVKIEPK